MNKSELIEKLAERSKVPKKKAEEVVETVFEAMKSALVQGQRIELRGFGSFVNRNYNAYIGRNPKTGAKIEVPPKRLPYFKPGKELKLRVDR
ncbi:MAG: integration host factor subunit beta [Deltaproteobacteria bacterium]|nr:integration host factor subunit beta [Deltaproteobacteria bacterium]MBI3078474.1 integration host factor subunit beta [Deltaproteobacteria bacterium]